MDHVLTVVGLTTAFRFYCCSRLSRARERLSPREEGGVRRRAVGHVAAVTLYPVKSARGMRLEHAQCTPTGLTTTDKKIHDRQWAVCLQKRDFAQAQARRQLPTLALVTTRRHGGRLLLEAPGMEPLSVPLNPPLDRATGVTRTNIKIIIYPDLDPPVGGVDCGDAAARWLQRYFREADARLVLVSPDVALRSFSYESERGGTESYSLRCHDVAPFMMASQASLDDLNARLERHVPMNQFRPNLEIAGCDAYAEDNWEEVSIGSAVFRRVDRCFRCMLITVSETTGTKDRALEPFETLKTYRPTKQVRGTSRPFFGVWYRLVKPGTVSVGDTIYLIKRKA